MGIIRNREAEAENNESLKKLLDITTVIEKKLDEHQIYLDSLEKKLYDLELYLSDENKTFSDLQTAIDAIKKQTRKNERQIRRYLDDYYHCGAINEKNISFRGSRALDYVINHYKPGMLLDVGSGEGIQSQIFSENNWQVTAIDYGQSVYAEKNKKMPQIRWITADFNTYPFEESFDCVWCCHTLEHQLNPGSFLSKLHSLVKEGGVLAITVPPLKQTIVGGHVTLWNAGLLLYHLVLAGFNCKNAHVRSYGYNISVILEKETVNVMDRLNYDSGDLAKIKEYLPEALDWKQSDSDTPFDGNIPKLNWDGQ